MIPINNCKYPRYLISGKVYFDALVVNDEISFNELKELLNITDGNLASHMKALEENGYIKVSKGFVGRKTNTTYRITKSGDNAFKAHIAALEKMIRSIE